MNFLFIIQGEGRGHISQAIALHEILITNNHSVNTVLIGKSKQREIPAYLSKNINSKIIPFNSPNFLKDKKNKSIKILKSLIYNFFKTPLYLKSIKQINNTVIQDGPDVIVNFYDLIGGLYAFIYKSKIPVYCIAHHYFYQLNCFNHTKKFSFQKYLLHFHSKLTSLNAKKIFCLSYANITNQNKKNVLIVPPLLRQEILNAETKTEDFFLCYILNNGYGKDIIELQNKNPKETLHVFWDDKNNSKKINENLIFHELNDEKFIEKLKSCKALISTAGFESICEAMYLCKPVLIKPTGNHYEQKCNAIDAQNVGAGIISSNFNLNLIEKHSDIYKQNTDFINWVKQAEHIFLSILTK